MPKKFSMKDLLNEHSRAEATAAASEANETPNTASGAASGFEVVDVPIEQIAVSPSNKYGIRDIEELAASIEGLGLMHNLVVKPPNENGQYELISGERRLLALKLLDWETAPCKIEVQESEALQELKLIHANAMARVLTDYEKTMQAARLKELLQQIRAEGYKFKGRMRDIVADILKVSSAQMGRMESIDKHLIPELKAEFEASKIGISAAYEASTLPHEAQAAAYEEYKETGQLDTGRVKSGQTDPPPEHKDSLGIIPTPQAGSDESFRNEISQKTPTDEQYRALEERARQQEAAAFVVVTMNDADGNKAAYSGNLAIIAAVSTEGEYGGIISADDRVTGLDYVTLAKVVCEECLSRIEDSESIDIMRVGLAALFDGGLEP